MIQIGALFRVQLFGGGVDQLVHLGRFIAELVRPGRAHRRPRTQPHRRRDRRVRTELVPAVGGVEVVVAIHPVQEARRVIGDQIDLDADFLHRLREIFAPQLGVFPPRGRAVAQLETDAVGSGRIACLVQQRLGLFHVVFIDRHVVGIVGAADTGNRTMARLGKAAHDGVDGEIQVQPVIDRLPDPQIGKDRVAQVEFHRRVGDVVFKPLRAHVETRVVAQPFEIGHRNPVEAGFMQLARLKRGGTRGLVGDEAPDHPVQIGIVRPAPVIIVAHPDDVLAALVFLELEGAGADRRLVVRVLEDVGAFVQVLGHRVAKIGHRRHDQVQRHRLGIVEHRGQRIGAIDRFQVRLQRRGIVQQRLPQLHRGKRHVVALERLAVVPAHAVAQLEGDGLAILAGRPLGRQYAHIAVIGLVDQRLHEAAGDLIDPGRGPQRRVQHPLFGVHVHEHRAAAPGLGPVVLRRDLLGRQRRAKRDNAGAQPQSAMRFPHRSFSP